MPREIRILIDDEKPAAVLATPQPFVTQPAEVPKPGFDWMLAVLYFMGGVACTFLVVGMLVNGGTLHDAAQCPNLPVPPGEVPSSKPKSGPVVPPPVNVTGPVPSLGPDPKLYPPTPGGPGPAPTLGGPGDPPKEPPAPKEQASSVRDEVKPQISKPIIIPGPSDEVPN